MNARCCCPPESRDSGRDASVGQPDALERLVDGVAVLAPQPAERPQRRAARPRRPRARSPARARRAACAARGSRSARARRTLRAGSPNSRTSPRVGRSSPSASRSSVVLPPPFGPAIATNSPSLDAAGRRRRAPAAPARYAKSTCVELDALAASERLPQRGEVPAHQREVVVAASAPPPASAPRSGRAPPSSRPPRARPSRRASARRAARRTRSSMCVVADEPGERRRASAALGSDSGSMPGDRDLLQAVARGEIAERRVARDELAPRAVREAARGSRASSREHARRERCRCARPAERGADPRRTMRAKRTGSSQTCGSAAGSSPTRRAPRARRRACRVACADGLLDRRLEAVREVEDDVGPLDAPPRPAASARCRAARRRAASGS